MKNGKKIGYARVSTREQNLDLQLYALKAAGCDEMFTDHVVSCTANVRDGLSQALGAIEEGDTLIVWKLDRLELSLGFLADLIAEYGREGEGTGLWPYKVGLIPTHQAVSWCFTSWPLWLNSNAK